MTDTETSEDTHESVEDVFYVIIGLVTNPLARRGDVLTVPPSTALDRAVSRGWVKMTHQVIGGEITDLTVSPERQNQAESDEIPSDVSVDTDDEEVPSGTVQDVVDWIGEDADRANAVLMSDEERTTVLRHAAKIGGGSLLLDEDDILEDDD